VTATVGEDPRILCRAMDFMLDCDEEVQHELLFAVSELLNLLAASSHPIVLSSLRARTSSPRDRRKADTGQRQ
jgi:hypothetical protein